MNKTVGNILGTIVSPKGKDLGLLILRLSAGGMMLLHGIQKITNYTAFSQNFGNPIGIGSGLSFALITSAEFAGAILLILGLFTRLSALALTIGMAVAAFIVPAAFSISGSELPLLYFAVFIAFTIAGSGRYSIDNYIAKFIAASRVK